MYARFDAEYRRMIFLARDEAMKYGSPYIESEHLLLAVLAADQSLNARIWDKHGGVDLIRQRIDAATLHGAPSSGPIEIPLGAESKRILDDSAEEADRCGHRQITAIHFLLAILEVKESLGSKVLESCGVTGLAVRKALG